MSVKLRVLVGDDGADTATRRYELVIDERGGHREITVGPADARDLIAEGRALLDQMEQQLDTAGVIDELLLAKIAAPHPTAAEANAPTVEGVATPPVGASAHCQGEGQQSSEEGM